MRKIVLTPVLLLAITVCAGCQLISPQSPTPIFPPTATLAEVLPSPTFQTTETLQVQSTPTLSPLPTKTSTPFVAVEGTITVDNFKLRTGPGFLFDLVNLYSINDTVQVYGRSSGDGWYFVSTSDSRSGWMKSEYITLSGDIADLPEIGVKDAIQIRGHVHNNAGEAMTGIGIIIFPGISAGADDSDNAVTDSSGSYYLFLPKTISGFYTIGVNAYGCESNAVDSQCQLLYGYPSAQSISIPQPTDISIEFVLPNK